MADRSATIRPAVRVQLALKALVLTLVALALTGPVLVKFHDSWLVALAVVPGYVSWWLLRAAATGFLDALSGRAIIETGAVSRLGSGYSGGLPSGRTVEFIWRNPGVVFDGTTVWEVTLGERSHVLVEPPRRADVQ